jgi:hypothetical protein
MFSVILYMLRETVDHLAPLLLFPSFPPCTVTFPKLLVILRPLYFTSMKLLKSTLLCRHSKVKLNKTLIRPVVTYGRGTWSMSAADENALRVFE